MEIYASSAQGRMANAQLGVLLWLFFLRWKKAAPFHCSRCSPPCILPCGALGPTGEVGVACVIEGMLVLRACPRIHSHRVTSLCARLLWRCIDEAARARARTGCVHKWQPACTVLYVALQDNVKFGSLHPYTAKAMQETGSHHSLNILIHCESHRGTFC